MTGAFAERVLNDANIPPEVRELVTSGVGTAAGIIFGFVAFLVAGVVFSTLGGVLGAVIFRKKTSAPPIIDIPPTQL